MSKFEETLSNVLEEIKIEVLPKIKIKEPIIYYGAKTKDCLGKFLGFDYINNKRNRPIIRLNCKEIMKSSKEYGINLYDNLLTTILHELGHAVQEIKGLEFNEEKAEEFAYNYYYQNVVKYRV
jgi:hypothetical protein